MEEVLNLETQDNEAALEERARELMEQMGVPPAIDSSAGINPKELAETVKRTLALPEIIELGPHLVPEHTVLGSQTENGVETLVSGVADAIAYDAGAPCKPSSTGRATSRSTCRSWRSIARRSMPMEMCWALERGLSF